MQIAVILYYLTANQMNMCMFNMVEKLSLIYCIQEWCFNSYILRANYTNLGFVCLFATFQNCL